MGIADLIEIEQEVGLHTLPRDFALPTTRAVLPDQGEMQPAKNSSFLPSEKLSPQIDIELQGRLKAAEKDLEHIRTSYIHSTLSYTPIGPLSFVQNPVETGEYECREGSSGINTGRHALKIGYLRSHAFIEQEKLLDSLIKAAESIQSHGSQNIQMSRKELVTKIEASITHLNSFRQGEWEHQRIQPEPEQSQLPAPSSRFWVDTCAPFFYLADILEPDCVFI